MGPPSDDVSTPYESREEAVSAGWGDGASGFGHEGAVIRRFLPTPDRREVGALSLPRPISLKSSPRLDLPVWAGSSLGPTPPILSVPPVELGQEPTPTLFILNTRPGRYRARRRGSQGGIHRSSPSDFTGLVWPKIKMS